MSVGAAERPRPKQWAGALIQARERMAHAAEFVVEGTLSRMVGMTLEAVGCEAAGGELMPRRGGGGWGWGMNWEEGGWAVRAGPWTVSASSSARIGCRWRASP